MKMWIVGVHHGDVQFKIILDAKFMLVNDDDGEMVMRRKRKRSFGSPGSCHETYAAQWSY
jgi:hypothetical protein